jgi:CheY-like chemotaxis protein
VDITSLCSDVFQLLRRSFDRSIDLRQEVRPRLVVNGHSGELHQVLMNLCINARDAMPDGGVLTIGAEEAAPEALEDVPLTSAYTHVVLSVTDTGVGMDETTKQRVFEPFFTTKPAGGGAGLGLATVYEVVTGHGGAVTVDSEPGKGTAVRVYLPAAEAGIATSRQYSSTARQRALKAAATGPGVGVLLVDDEQLVRRSLERVLRVAGHRVEQARDGQEALQHFEPGRSQPDVVLLDLDMPRLDGVSTLQGIRALAPETAVVCVSGCLDEAREKNLRSLGVREILEKPCAAAELLDAINNAVSSRETPGPSKI